MRRVLFLASHHGSGSFYLVNLLNANERIEMRTEHNTYLYPTDLNFLTSHPHKCRSSAAIYGDHLLYNINFQCKRLYKWCQFIYLVRGGKDSMTHLYTENNEQAVYNYYCFRMRRIYEMAKHTPGSVFLIWNDLVSGKAFPLIEDFLSLKTPIPLPSEELFVSKPVSPNTSPALLDKAQDCFEYYLYKIRNLDLMMVNP